MSIASEISRILQAKADIKIAIEGKGVTVSGSATLDDYDDYIDQIQQGSSPTLITKSITANGTYNASSDNADGYSSVEVNVSGGGGGSSYTLLASKEFTVSTTSTSNITVGTIDAGSSAYTSSKLLYVCIRDKAGPRAGHFYGSDNFIQNHNQIIGSTGTISTLGRNCISVPSSGSNYTISSSGYGVYAYSVKNTGTITIYARYSSSTTNTIDGTFKCDVYLLEWPNNVSPFVPLSQ